MEIGTGIKVALVKSGKSREWLGAQLGVTHQRVTSIINRGTCRLDTLVQIVDVFGISLDEFMVLGERIEIEEKGEE